MNSLLKRGTCERHEHMLKNYLYDTSDSSEVPHQIYLAIFVSGKIEMVKSQFGLAVSAVVTVVSSLFMSLSLCFFFGLNPTLNGR